ncbi:MAG: UbiD family decarboxylase [Desulfurococcaceae archaeon]
MDLGSYMEKILSKYKEVKYVGKISREYEVTKLSYSNRETVIEFNINDSEVTCVSNILTNRRDLYVMLNASNDRDAYLKIEQAIDKPAELEFVDFNKYFLKTDWTLKQLPFIKYFREDGGYYLTSSIVVACIDEICNASIHRIMYVDEEHGAIRIVPRDLYRIYNMYRERGKDTPIAILLGLNPVAELAAATSTSFGLFELKIAAKLLNNNLFVKTPKYGIPVPLQTPIVVEGVISKDNLVDEGPFTDILGLLDTVRKQPVLKIENIYLSKISKLYYHAIVPSLWDHIYLMSFPREALIYVYLTKQYPNVTGVRLTTGSSCWLHAVVSVKQIKPGDARAIGLTVLNIHPSVKHVIVVDDDIDIDNIEMIEWAIATRVKASEDIIVLKDLPGSTLDPRSVNGIGDKVIIDATKPFNEDWSKYRRVQIP